MDKARARALLDQERRRLDLLDRAVARGHDDAVATSSPEDPVNGAVHRLAEETSEALGERLRDRWGALERAEARLAAGTYGASILSGRPIPDERLEAFPLAELTVEEAAARTGTRPPRVGVACSNVDLQGGLVRACLDDLVIALYVTIDELLGPDPSGRPGRKPRLSDAELVCLAVAQVLLGSTASTAGCGSAYGRLGHLFPYLPKQPGYNKRLRAARWLLGWSWRHLAGRTPVVRDDPAAARRHPGPLRRLADDGQALGAARLRRLRLVPQPLAAGTGASSCISSPPRRHARSPGVWPTPSWASARSPTALLDRAAASGPARSSSSTRAWPAPRSSGTSADLERGAWSAPTARDEPRPVRHPAAGAPVDRDVIDTLKGQLGLEHHGGRTLGRGAHPGRPAAAGPGRRHLAQLAARHRATSAR